MRSPNFGSSSTGSWAGFLAGAGIGAACMYLIDPNSGARRRALIRDRTSRVSHKTADGLDAAARDLVNRTYGTWTSARLRSTTADVPDQVLVERVRAKLGRYVSHPHAIEVDADRGCVTLRGKILKREVKPLWRAVRRIPGVLEIDNLLEQHETAGHVPSLQGGRPRRGQPLDVFQRSWSPATRMLVGSIGSALAAYGASRRDAAGTAACVAGTAVLLRAATNLEARPLTGVAAGRRAVDIQKTIHINAPVATVFDVWTNVENFPHFMTNVLSVRATSVEGMYHWRIAGPARSPIEFDAVITRFEPNRLIAWKTVEGSAVAHAGVIHFELAEGGSTRVHIQFSYNPPGGVIGHALAALLGSDPKAKMDADLARLKTAVETGTPPRDAAQPVAKSPEVRL